MCECGFVFIKDEVKPLEEYKATPSNVEVQLEPRKRGRKRKLKINRKGEAVDWTTLVREDRIKVVGGGPYWVLADGNKVSLGYRGIYKIDHLDNKGIVAFPVGKKTKESGRCYIYMGPKGKSTTGCMRRPHRIRKIDQATTEKLYVA